MGGTRAGAWLRLEKSLVSLFWLPICRDRQRASGGIDNKHSQTVQSMQITRNWLDSEQVRPFTMSRDRRCRQS